MIQKPFSTQTIEALVDVVTGGAGNTGASRPPWRYRSGPQIESFLGHANIELQIGGGSRLPSVREVLKRENRTVEGRRRIAALLEQVADPREHIDAPDDLVALLEYLNKRLEFDDVELRRVGKRCRLLSKSATHAAAATVATTADRLDFDSVQRAFETALAEADVNPEHAVTAACTAIESVCKCILDEMGEPYPAKQDVSGLANAVEQRLQLSPARPELREDVRRVLGGLASMVRGIGALRTHAGDAHGRGKGVKRIDGRIARLAIHAASTAAIFYIETWQRRAGLQQIQPPRRTVHDGELE